MNKLDFEDVGELSSLICSSYPKQHHQDVRKWEGGAHAVSGFLTSKKGQVCKLK